MTTTHWKQKKKKYFPKLKQTHAITHSNVPERISLLQMLAKRKKEQGASEKNLHVLGQVLMLHRAVYGTLQTLIAVIHLLLRQPVQSLLDVQIIQVVVQIIVPQTWNPTKSIKHPHLEDRDQMKMSHLNYEKN